MKALELAQRNFQVLIIALGIMSYTKASQGIIQKYEKSSLMSINMMSDYFELGLKTIDAKAIQIGLDDTVIQNRTSMTVNAAKQAENSVKIQGKALITTVDAFTGINEEVDKMTRNMDKILAGMKKMEQAKEDTLIAMESISAVSEETAAASSELGDTASEQLKAVEELNIAA